MMFRYFVIYKPFGILSQFSGEAHTLKTLGDFPKDVYPVGRLDKDSEGLLLITNDKVLNHYLLNPQFAHQRTYLAQVEGVPDEEALRALQSGVPIKVDGKVYKTKPAKATLKKSAPLIPERDPPIRYRKTVPDSWVELILIEGKNRQVRKMTAAVDHPTLRLVRWSMEQMNIEGFEVGEVRELEQEAIYTLLKVNPSKLQVKTKAGARSNKKPSHQKRRKGR
ncbi:pseudouridine synthase [Echinicola strongylocentroti]|uniref:Pseudouridine synthase n=1 Tax=Echinicola strongylocentroti TaxID=1795355 RepID=A0A2Z4IIY6_9BACT|nr:pseudouridine synthase [Echinicola strongylocentroti]AWW31102.1 pseudouridine synthase [Echinicola strongylocentroti]